MISCDAVDPGIHLGLIDDPASRGGRPRLRKHFDFTSETPPPIRRALGAEGGDSIAWERCCVHFA